MKTLSSTLQRLIALNQISAKPLLHLFASLSLGVFTLFCTTTINAATADVSAGGFYTAALKSDGTVWAWGSNGFGRLGNGSTVDSFVPVQVSGLSGMVAVSAGYAHAAALKSDGTVWAWGFNGYGQLGNNSTVDSRVPVQVSGLSGVVAVSAGDFLTAAVKSDGTVWAWGSNELGKLGNNSTVDSPVPVQVFGLSGVVAVSAGNLHTAALKSDGTVWAWGSNGQGQLGNNSTVDSRVPVQVSGLSGVVAVSAGQYHTAALKSDGTVWVWGYNYQGRLGNSTTGALALVPVQVYGLGGVVAVSTNIDHTVALKSDGTVWAWGYNREGKLGNGSTVDSFVPVQVSGLSGMVAVSAGAQHTAALKSDGTVWVWGGSIKLDNESTIVGSLVPSQVVGPDGQGFLNLGQPSVTTSTPLPVATIPVILPPPASPPGVPVMDTPTAQLPACNSPMVKPVVTVPGEGELYFCSGTFDMNKPTVVISHGWNPKIGDAATPEWMTEMAGKIGDQANVLLWNWQKNAETLSLSQGAGLSCIGNPEAPIYGCKIPYVEVPSSGNGLGSAIDALLCAIEGSTYPACLQLQTPPTYQQKIHLVGHSLGTGVITWAADSMKRYHANIDQLSLLDSAYLTTPPGRPLTLYKLRQSGVFVDNYRSGVGLIPLSQPWAYVGAVDVNVFLPNFVLPDCTNPYWSLLCTLYGAVERGHGYANLWFTSSWDNFRDRSLLADIDAPLNNMPYGTAWSAARGSLRPLAAPSYYSSLFPQSKWYLQTFPEAVSAYAAVTLGGLSTVTASVGSFAAAGVTYALTETKRLSTQATTALVNEAVAAQTAIKVKALNTFDTASDIAGVAVDKAGHATWQFFDDLTGGALDLSLNSDATIHLNQFIPADATSMRFNFEFLVADQGTLLEAFIDGVPVFIARSSDFFGKGNQLSEWINAAPFAGKTVNIAFRLSNPVEGNHGTVRLDDLFFARITPVDAPYAVAVAPGIARLGSKIQLDGTRSTDLGGTLPILSYKWVQVSGPITSLQSELSPSATFTPTTSGQYQFALRVSDGVGVTDPATLTVSVLSLGDIDGDGDVDSNDLAKITSALNTKANGPNDLRDIDGDGKITALDSRKLVTLCTRPRCATR